MALCVGVLAVQGAVLEHHDALRRAAAARGLDIQVLPVRTPADLARVHGLVIPGGESTTISRLLRSSGLQEEILARVAGAGDAPDGHGDLALFGTCAGLILISSRATHDVEEKDIRLLGLLEAEVDRNAFGRQRESFETTLEVEGIGAMPAVFIRAPALTRVWGATRSLAALGDRPVVAVRGCVLGTAFHPELTPDTRLHERFLAMVEEAAGLANIRPPAA